MWRRAARLSASFLLLTSVAAASGCVSADGMSDKLRDTSSAYNRSLRWGDIDRAAAYLPIEAQAAFMATHDAFTEELVIADYEMSRLDLDRQTGIAASRCQIVWHTADSTIIKTTIIDQAWQFHDGKFVLVDERRAGGVPLGLFAELEEDPHPYLPGLQAYRETHEIGKENKKKKKRRRRKKDREPEEPVPTESGTAHAKR